MSIDFKRLLAMLFVTKPCAVVLSVYIGVGGCLCPISSSAWRAGMASRQLMKSALSSASAAEDITDLMILATVRTDPLLVGYSAVLDKKKCPPARLLALDSERYEASLWPARTMSLA